MLHRGADVEQEEAHPDPRLVQVLQHLLSLEPVHAVATALEQGEDRAPKQAEIPSKGRLDLPPLSM